MISRSASALAAKAITGSAAKCVNQPLCPRWVAHGGSRIVRLAHQPVYEPVAPRQAMITRRATLSTMLDPDNAPGRPRVKDRRESRCRLAARMVEGCLTFSRSSTDRRRASSKSSISTRAQNIGLGLRVTTEDGPRVSRSSKWPGYQNDIGVAADLGHAVLSPQRSRLAAVDESAPAPGVRTVPCPMMTLGAAFGISAFAASSGHSKRCAGR